MNITRTTQPGRERQPRMTTERLQQSQQSSHRGAEHSISAKLVSTAGTCRARSFADEDPAGDRRRDAAPCQPPVRPGAPSGPSTGASSAGLMIYRSITSREGKTHGPAMVVQATVLNDQREGEVAAVIPMGMYGLGWREDDYVVSPVEPLPVDHRVATALLQH